MHIDNETLKKISSMSNSDFSSFISSIASGSGFSLPNLSDADIAKIKELLRSANPGDPTWAEALAKASSNMKHESHRRNF